MHASAFATPVLVRQAARAHEPTMTISRRIYPGNPAKRQMPKELLSDVIQNTSTNEGSGSGYRFARVSASVLPSSTAENSTSSVEAGTGGQTRKPTAEVTENSSLGCGTLFLGHETPDSAPNSSNGSQGNSPGDANNGQRPGDSSGGSTDGSTNTNGGTQGNGDQSGQPPNGINPADILSGNGNGNSSPPPPNGTQSPPDAGNNNGGGGSPPPNGTQSPPDAGNNNGG
ncbi:hypothetical protein AX14_003944, partial [Amanita brunnescens Koide BX004]